MKGMSCRWTAAVARPRGSTTITIRAAVWTYRRVEELHRAGMSYREAQKVVIDETDPITSRGAVEYRYKHGREIAPKAEAAAAALAGMQRTLKMLSSGDPFAGLRRTLRLLSHYRK